MAVTTTATKPMHLVSSSVSLLPLSAHYGDMVVRKLNDGGMHLGFAYHLYGFIF